MSRCVSAAAIASLAFTSLASAETINVCPSGCAHTTIASAVAAAQNGDVVQVSGGVYYDSGIDLYNPNSGAPLLITIRGSNDSDNPTVIDTQGAYYAFYAFNANNSLVFDGLEIRNATWHAVYCAPGSSPIFRNCIFRSNTGPGGSAVISYNAGPQFINCVFIDNYASNEGGAVYCDGGNPQFTDCGFYGNHAHYGGGFAYEAAQATLTNCTFVNNTATYYGGGVRGKYAESAGIGAYLYNCTFDSNHAYNGSGGGVCNDAGLIHLIGCTLTNNTPNAAFNVIYGANGAAALPMTIESCEIHGNGHADGKSEVQIDGLVLLVGENHISHHSPPAACSFDLNADGVVDGSDMALLIAAWGLVCPG